MTFGFSNLRIISDFDRSNHFLGVVGGKRLVCPSPREKSEAVNASKDFV